MQNNTRKTSHLINIIQYDASGNVVLPAALTLGVAPGAADDSAKVPSTAWVRSLLSGSYVPSSRTITINGTTADLSANRSFSVGDVVSTGSYANPAWITSLAWSKITDAPAFITGITSGMVTTALGYTPVPTTRTLTINGVTYDLSANRSWDVTVSGGVSSFNTRTGAVTLTSGDVTGALGYTPYNSSNPSGYITSAALTWTNISGRPTALSSFSNDVGFITSIGFSYSTGVNANHVVQRDGNGYIYANHVNFNTPESENPSINSFITSNGDGWSRKATLAHVKNSIRGVADGTWGINITGSAGYASGAGNSDTVDGFHADAFFRNLGFEGGGANANTLPESRSAFTYANGAPWSGPVAHFGASGYGLQLNAVYHGDGYAISYRTRNGDTGTWNTWREFVHSGNYANFNSYVSLSISGTLNLPNNALISVNNEPDIWGMRLRTTTSTTNLGASLKNIIYCGGGTVEGFAVTGVGTGATAFEVRNDGNAWVKSNLFVTAPAGRIQAGSTSIDGILFDSSRSALIARGNYPHLELWSEVENSNHGGTIRFSGYDNGSSGAYKSWNIGTAGSNLYFLDIAYGGASNSNPHAGIAGLGAAYGYAGAFNMMRFHNNGNIGIGNFGTYESEGNTPSYKLDVRGTGRFTGALYANSIVDVGSGGDAVNIAGAAGRVSFRDQDLSWTGYVGFRGNQGVLEFPGRNVTITSGYNGYVEINTGTNDYLSGRLTVPFGSVNARRGFTSEGNPWGTANSAYFPNGITTAGGTNWVYGLTYLGNAPSNGSGAEVRSNGSSWFRSSSTSQSFGYAGIFVDRSSAATNYAPWSFESEYGNHSWGVVARFHIQQSSPDRPSIVFSSGSNNTRWGVGYCYADDHFRISQNIGMAPDGSSGGWGTERFRINTDGSTYCFSSFTASGDVTAYSDVRIKKDITTLTNALEKVQAIRGVTYKRTDIQDTDKVHVGVVAQEVLAVIPELISETDQGLYTVAYGNMAALFIEAIKEQQAQIEELKKQIDYLVENR